MGVESKFYILPATSGMRPSVAKVLELIGSLKAARYLCDPQSPDFQSALHGRNLTPDAFYEGFNWHIGREKGSGTLKELESRLNEHHRSDILIRWRISDLVKTGLKYPLTATPEGEPVYYDIELHLAEDTIYHTSEIIEPLAEPITCPCDATLESKEGPDTDFFYDSRLPNYCDACNKPTNYAALPMIICNGWTGKETPALGGVTYRFCVAVDCGKMIPKEGTTVANEFRGVIEQCLSCSTRIFQDFS